MRPSSLCLQPISTNVEFAACRFIVRKNSRILPDSTRKLLWFEKYISIFGVENGQPREPTLCQLYRHTFVPHCNAAR